MEQEQPLSGINMLIWSIAVVLGILALAWFTQPQPARTAETAPVQQDWTGLFSWPVDITSTQHSAQISIQINFASNARPQHPGFACPDPCPRSPLFTELTSSQKPLVISFGQ